MLKLISRNLLGYRVILCRADVSTVLRDTIAGTIVTLYYHSQREIYTYFLKINLIV